MSEYITVEYTNQNSIFLDLDDLDDSEDTKTANITLRLPIDFIQGFLTGNRIINDISNITTNVIFNPSHIVFRKSFDKVDYDRWRVQNRFRRLDFFNALCTIYDINLNMNYAMIINIEHNTTIIQFDTIDFLDGILTYLEWIISSSHSIDGIFDKSRSYQLNIEDQFPIVNKRSFTKKLLNDLLLSDLTNIIWEYVMSKCNDIPSDISSCINEIDIIDENDDTYTVYEDISDVSGITCICSDKTSLCYYCRSDVILNPFLSKTTLI